MRVFAKPTSLERLSLEARIVYTGFAVFLLIGYATSAWLWIDDELGVSAQSAQRYYLGENQAAKVSETNDAFEIPPELEEREQMRFAKSPRQVMETFHFHMFSVPVCLLIVAHLFMMSGMSTKPKAAIIAFSTATTLLHVVLPPLVRFVSPGFAVLFFPSAAAMALTWTFMTVAPIWEMWRPPRS
jgi:hypothetical protein